ncbi:hypothetical protein CA236_03975 [Sphingomonas sp. ABOLG]|nr:hypothetical protein CA236_03975 [Sphingomonas sp. ABOLG]
MLEVSDDVARQFYEHLHNSLSTNARLAAAMDLRRLESCILMALGDPELQRMRRRKATIERCRIIELRPL